MDESPSCEFEAACEEYGHLLRQYERALKDRDPQATDIFNLSKTAWENVRVLAPSDGPQANANPEMYLILAYSTAVGVGHSVEAERLYGLLSDEERRTLDGLEEREPGRFKIWLPPH